MPQPDIILSNPAVSDRDLAGWFESLGWLDELIRPEGPMTFVELCARRGGLPGHLKDHPSIERLEELMKLAAENGCGWRSILIPLDVAGNRETLGKEISAVNGWIDLASYAEIPRMTFTIADPPCCSSPDARYALEETIGYAAEMDVTFSVCVDAASRSDVTAVLDTLNKQFEKPAGYEWRVDESAIGDQNSLSLPPSFHSLRLILSQPDKLDTVKITLPKVLSQLPDSISAVTVVLG